MNMACNIVVDYYSILYSLLIDQPLAWPLSYYRIIVCLKIAAQLHLNEKLGDGDMFWIC